jgi:hypothetical protein
MELEFRRCHLKDADTLRLRAVAGKLLSRVVDPLSVLTRLREVGLRCVYRAGPI